MNFFSTIDRHLRLINGQAYHSYLIPTEESAKRRLCHYLVTERATGKYLFLSSIWEAFSQENKSYVEWF